MERDQAKSKSRKSKNIVETTSSPTETTTAKKTRSASTTPKLPNSIQDQLNAIEATKKPKENTPSIEDVLKQYNLNGLDIATTPKSSKYGKTNDAILASILKEQGIAPPTPKSLEVPPGRKIL